MVRLEEIAKEAGLSIGTVERALYNKGRIAADTKQRVLEIADRLGYKPNIVAKGLAARKKHLTLGFFYVDDDFSPLQKNIAENARKYAKTLEGYGVNVLFIPLEGMRPDLITRGKAIWEILKEHPLDGFAALGPVAEEVAAVLKEHHCPTIPFVSYNIEADNSIPDEICFIGCDFEKIGSAAAGLAGLMTNGKGRACIISIDYPELSSTKLRIQSFEEGLRERYPEIELTESLVTSPYEDFDRFAASADQFLESQPTIDVIYFIYAGADMHSREIAELGKKNQIRIIAGDLTTDCQKMLLANGAFAAEIAQDTHELGKKTLETLFNYLALDVKPDGRWCKTGLNIKIPENVMDE